LGSALPNLKFFSEAAVAASGIYEMIDRVPEIDSEDMSGKVLQTVSGEIQFRNVAFSYPSRPDSMIFDNFCLTIPARQTVALVGSSGSGKSTSISLLERFYDPLKGEILLDGQNIKSLQLKWLRSQIGLVSQEPTLFATSIRENILFGRDDATMDEIIAVAIASNAHDFIRQLPDGYNTQVGSYIY
jgi:ATP-binding cassette subfamily B (MDR/TAP) protein 1